MLWPRGKDGRGKAGRRRTAVERHMERNLASSWSAGGRMAAQAAAVCGFAVVAVRHAAIAALCGGEPGGDLDRLIALVAGTLAWIAAGVLCDSLLDRVVWKGVAAAALGRPVPAILRTLTSVCIHVVAVSCAVAFVHGKSVAAFLTALGAGGVVLGLALRGMVEDLFAGIAINVDRAVGIGDWIRLPARNGGTLTGRVRDMGWRCTQVETDEGMLLLVPNGVLGREVVTNLSRPAEPTRYECELVLDHGVPAERGRRILGGALEAVQPLAGFVAEQRPAVLVGESTDRGVTYLLRYWIRPWNPLSPTAARDRVMSRALADLAAAGIAPAIEKSELSFARDRVAAPAAGAGTAAPDRLRLLERVRLFDGLEGAERARIAAAMRPVELAAGATLFRQDAVGDTLYIVAEGAVDVLVRGGGAADAARVATLGAGEFLGEMSLLTGEPRRATVRAATGCLLYELSRGTVATLVAERPGVSEILSHTLASRKAALESAGAAPDPAVLETGRRSLLHKMLAIFGGGQSA